MNTKSVTNISVEIDFLEKNKKLPIVRDYLKQIENLKEGEKFIPIMLAEDEDDDWRPF